MVIHINKTPSYYLLTGILFLIVLKSFIRPVYQDAPDGIIFLMGILPNLLGSFLLVYGIKVFDRYLYFFYDTNLLRYYCFLCFAALLINEYIQLIPLFLRTFDYFDIAASVVGLTAGYSMIVRSQVRQERTIATSY